MSRPIPPNLVPSSSSDARKTPSLEITHVHHVYDRVASQWAGTRYKAWPCVETFMSSQQFANNNNKFEHLLVGELGCGNGKNLQCLAAKCMQVIASDISVPLCEIAAIQTKQADVHVADVTFLPLRSEVFDLVICIAVLHHLSTRERRLLAVSECARVLVPGGRALFLAWAQDQTTGYSGHKFESQDVFVPFHQKIYLPGFVHTFVPDDASVELQHGVMVEEKRSIVFQRYCHVFAQGELESLVEECGLQVTKSFEEVGNWGVEVLKKAKDT